MVFDPFGDFETRGYLRNHAGQKNLSKVKNLEHASFERNVLTALQDLGHSGQISYQDVKRTHKTLFGDVYPWAGQDRSRTAADLAITKGPVVFMPAPRVETGMQYALTQANDPRFMRARPGEVMGNMAYAHPFLDGNGRTLMTVHAELCRRAGFHIDWSRTTKAAYLTALTREIDAPGTGHLDTYLAPFVRDGAIDRTATAARQAAETAHRQATTVAEANRAFARALDAAEASGLNRKAADALRRQGAAPDQPGREAPRRPHGRGDAYGL